MAIIVGSARIDENGKTTGGKVGDQTGKEVSTQNFYWHSKGWDVLRAKDSKVAQKLAKAMKDACDNDHIGYDQTNRYIINSVKKYGSLKAIPVDCEADCSGLERATIYEATGKDVGDFRTVNQVDILEKSGLFEKHFKLTSTDQLYNGDILVTCTSGHTVTVISGAKDRNASTKTTKPTVPQPTVKVGSKGTSAKQLQECLNYLGITDSNGNKLKTDGEIGVLTISALRKFQEQQFVDGIYGNDTYEKMKTAIK